MWILLVVTGLVCVRMLGRLIGCWVADRVLESVLRQTEAEWARRNRRLRQLERLLAGRLLTAGQGVMEYAYGRLDQNSSSLQCIPAQNWHPIYRDRELEVR